LNHETEIRIQNELRNWINLSNWKNPYAVTLTFKKNIVTYFNCYESTIHLNPQIASDNFGKFLHVLNRKIFGNLTSRYGIRLNVFPIFEQSNTKHLHYHSVFDKPNHISDEKFRLLIELYWNSSLWGNSQIDIQSSADNGWVSYITKLADKENLADSIDWKNTHISI